jgi:hypothetical protein
VSRRQPATRLAVLFQELETVADRLGLAVVLDRGNFTGGICQLEGEAIIVLNRSQPLEQRMRVLLDALRERDVSGVYLKPAVRELLEVSVSPGLLE